MKCVSRTRRTSGTILASAMLLTTLLQAEEPVVDIQIPTLQQSQSQDPQAKGPTGEEPANKAAGSLILSVKLALMADQRVFPHNIEVEAKEQEVVLSGKVSSEAEKLASTEVARGVEGVRSVVNKLEVAKELQSALMKRRDQLITECVKEVFNKSATLKTADFDVKTESGVVALSGKTRFQVIALEAAEAARQVPGVKAVKTDAVRLEAE